MSGKGCFKSVYVCVLLLLVYACSISVDLDENDESYSEQFSQVVAVREQTGLRVENVNGEVTILGMGEADSVHIRARKVVWDDDEKAARAHIDDIQIAVIEGEGKIEVVVSTPRSRERTYEVDFHILVPGSLGVEVDNLNGDIVVEGMEAEVDVENTNGRIDLDDISGPVKVDNTNGTVTLTDVTGSVEVDNSNGGIEAEVTLPPGAACRMTTTNGSIALEIPSDTSAALDARTTNGTVRVSNLTVKDSSSRGNAVEGTLGDGEGSIFLRTTNGNILVEGR